MPKQPDIITKTVKEMFDLEVKEAGTLADFVRKNLTATEKLVSTATQKEDWKSVEQIGKALQTAGENLKLEKLTQGGQALCECAEKKDSESARRVAQKINRVIYTYV